MNFYIFAYVETAATDCVALSTILPVALIGDNRPSAAGTPPSVAGTIFWNAFDAANGNSWVYDSKKVLLISNSDAADDVNVTIKTVDGTVNGFASTVADMVVAVATGKLALVGFLPASFRDGTLVKMSIAEDGGTAITDCKFAIVKLG